MSSALYKPFIDAGQRLFLIICEAAVEPDRVFYGGNVFVPLFGIEEASVETEDPFGRDENCLDMETFTMGIARDAGQMAASKSAVVAIGFDQE